MGQTGNNRPVSSLWSIYRLWTWFRSLDGLLSSIFGHGFLLQPWHNFPAIRLRWQGPLVFEETSYELRSHTVLTGFQGFQQVHSGFSRIPACQEGSREVLAMFQECAHECFSSFCFKLFHLFVQQGWTIEGLRHWNPRSLGLWRSGTLDFLIPETLATKIYQWTLQTQTLDLRLMVLK